MIKYSSEDPTVAPRNMPTDKHHSYTRSQTNSDPDALKQVSQEAQVIIQRNIIILILRINSYPSSRQRATRTFQLWSTRISHIGVQTVYYDTRALFSSTKSLIWYNQQCDQLKVIISYKYVMDLNTFLFDTTKPKISHSWVVQAHVAYMYVQSSIPISMACKDRKYCIRPVPFFLPNIQWQ